MKLKIFLENFLKSFRTTDMDGGPAVVEVLTNPVSSADLKSIARPYNNVSIVKFLYDIENKKMHFFSDDFYHSTIITKLKLGGRKIWEGAVILKKGKWVVHGGIEEEFDDAIKLIPNGTWDYKANPSQRKK